MTFLEEFFGTGNGLRFEDLGTAEAPTKLRLRLQPFLVLHEHHGPITILPRARAPEAKTEWYFLCRSPADRRWAKDLLRAFVGGSFLTEQNRERTLDRADPIDTAVLNTYGEMSFAMPVAASSREKITPRLERMARLLAHQPERRRALVRPTGTILRDFELALLSRDEAVATECIISLRDGQRLSVQNIEFLQIRRDVAVGKYAEALASPRFETYQELGFPRRVVGALLEAVWEKEVAPWAGSLPAAEIVARFSTEVRPRFGALLKTKAGLKGPSIAPLFLLDAAASEPSVPALVAELAQELAGGEWAAFASGVAGLVAAKTPPAPSPASSGVAHEAFYLGEVDRAYQLALALAPSFERALLLLRCAREMDTFASVRNAFEALGALAAEEKVLFEKNRVLSRLVDEVRTAALGTSEHAGEAATESISVKQLPQDWIAWLERLGEPDEWIGAAKAAEKGQREWSLAACLADPPSIEKVTNLIGQTRPAWGDVAFRDSEPFLIAALEEVEARESLRPVIAALYLQMATDDDSRMVWSAMARLFDLELRLGITRATYREHLDCLSAGLSRMRVPALVDPAVDLLETLSHYPRQDSGAFTKCVDEIHALFLTVADKADRTAKCLFARLAKFLGLDLALPPSSASVDTAPADVWEALAGKELALYSLSKFTLERTREVVADLCPTAKIKCFEEHVATPAMVAAARNTDLFVIDTRHAKHSATGAIEANRSPGKRTVLVHALGNSALLRAIETALRA